MSWGARKEAPPRPARSLRCPAPPRGVGRGGDFARGPEKFRAPRAPVRTLKADLHNLYNLKIGDPTKVARQVEYLLEEDRFQCDPKGYEV